MDNILITGGAGFIGSHLFEVLSSEYNIIILDNLQHGNKLSTDTNFIFGDVRDSDLVLKTSKNCRYIIHLAAFLGTDFVSDGNMIECMETEFIGGMNIAKASIKNNVEKIIYTSTSGVYNDDLIVSPKSGYAAAKLNQEIYFNNLSIEHGISICNFRLFNVYGKNQDDRFVVKKFLNQSIKNENITVYDKGLQTRDFTYIDDLTKCFKLTLENFTRNDVFDLCYGKETRIIDLAQMIIDITNSKSTIEKLQTPTKLEQFNLKRRLGSPNKLKELLNFQAKIDLKSGLLKIIS